MNEGYIDSILDAFYSLKIEDVPDAVIHQIRRTLLDYIGCTAYSASHKLCEGLKETVKAISKEGESYVWGDSDRLCAEGAAFINAARTSNIELDDVSGMGASVHPGVYVWSTLFATYELYKPSKETVIKAVLLGYELCLRMGLKSTERVRELGLHGPGLNGAFASLAVAGIVAGLTKDEMKNAIGIAGSLLPLCPFISFTSGTDSKDFYGGWPCYLGLVAVNAARHQLTGPFDILSGKKSLISIYSGKEPDAMLGKDFLIMKIVFKEFSSCASVHPAASAVKAILKENSFTLDDISHITVETYPYSYELNSGVTLPLNVSSARLYLPYAISTALHTGALMPDAFTDDMVKSSEYLSLMDKIEVINHTEYGNSSFSIRGSIVRIELKDGRVLEKEAIGSEWSKGVSDDMLKEKFEALASCFDSDNQKDIEDKAFSFDGDLTPFIALLKTL